MRMAIEPGPESPSARADGSGPRDVGALAGRAWLAVLPDELAAQRRVMAGLADRCEAWPLVTSLLIGCSLGRGQADALSDIDAALGVDAECGEAGAERVGTVEAMVVATLPELGTVVDVLRHQAGPADQWVRRIFAQFADGTQLDLAVAAEAQIEARRRGGGAPDFILLYQAPAPPCSRETQRSTGSAQERLHRETTSRIRTCSSPPGRWRGRERRTIRSISPASHVVTSTASCSQVAGSHRCSSTPVERTGVSSAR